MVGASSGCCAPDCTHSHLLPCQAKIPAATYLNADDATSCRAGLVTAAASGLATAPHPVLQDGVQLLHHVLSSAPWLALQDYFQLLRPGLQLLRPPKKDAQPHTLVAGMQPYTAASFQAEWGVRPDQVWS